MYLFVDDDDDVCIWLMQKFFTIFGKAFIHSNFVQLSKVYLSLRETFQKNVNVIVIEQFWYVI